MRVPTRLLWLIFLIYGGAVAADPCPVSDLCATASTQCYQRPGGVNADWQNAAQLCTQALAVAPALTHNHYHLAQAFERGGWRVHALWHYQQVIQAAPYAPSAIKAQARAERLLNQLSRQGLQQELHYPPTLAQDWQDPELQRLKAANPSAWQRLELATTVQAASALVASAPNFAPALYHRAWLQLTAEPAQARRDLRQASQLAPDWGKVASLQMLQALQNQHASFASVYLPQVQQQTGCIWAQHNARVVQYYHQAVVAPTLQTLKQQRRLLATGRVSVAAFTVQVIPTVNSAHFDPTTPTKLSDLPQNPDGDVIPFNGEQLVGRHAHLLRRDASSAALFQAYGDLFTAADATRAHAEAFYRYADILAQALDKFPAKGANLKKITHLQ